MPDLASATHHVQLAPTSAVRLPSSVVWLLPLAWLWLELLRDDCGIPSEVINPKWNGADELMAIFTTMVSKLRKSDI